MTNPVSVQLDDDVGAARETEAARTSRRERIRRQSEAVGRYVAENPDARAFYEGLGTPSADIS